MLELSRRELLGGAAALVAATQLPTSAEAGPLPSLSGLTWASGAFDPYPDSLVAYRGRRLDTLTLYSPRRTWEEIRTRTASALAATLINRQETMAISYPMFPDDNNPKTHGPDMWRRAAEGEFDAIHDYAATELAKFPARYMLRIGWEWNNKTFTWSCLDVALAPYYRTYFRRTVDRMRARLPGALIDWSCDKEGKANASIHHWYPGGDWVDFLGCDKYDFWPALTGQSVWDQDYNATRLGGPRGIGAWLAYARSNGKRLSVGEWGLIDTSRNGGGDNPFFVTQMLTFFKTNAVDIAYENYFNKNTSSFTHRLQDYPLAGAAYRSFIMAG